jgi:hypothetical protein
MTVNSPLRFRQVLPAFALLVLLGSAKPASASFLYDITQTVLNQTHEQFTVDSLITSSTVITAFSLNTSSASTVTQIALDPVPTGQCQGIAIHGNGPCLDIRFSNNNEVLFSDFPTFASVGTFVHPSGQATITITDLGTAAPEPSSMAMLLAAGLALIGRLVHRRSTR